MKKKNWLIFGGVTVLVVVIAIIFFSTRGTQETSVVERDPEVITTKAWDNIVEKNKNLGASEEDFPEDSEFKENFECALEQTIDELSDEAIVGLQNGDVNNIPIEDNAKFSNAWRECAKNNQK